jgi:hypothetical protein
VQHKGTKIYYSRTEAYALQAQEALFSCQLCSLLQQPLFIRSTSSLLLFS